MGKVDEVMLSSAESMKLSLEAIRTGHAGLSERRKKLLKRVPESGNWITLERNSITNKDIAYLSAATRHEFALLRGKKEDVLFHGTERHCNFGDKLLAKLKLGKLELVVHSHSDWDIIVPSLDDRRFLKSIGQKKSVIISYITGKELIFGSSVFEDI